MLLTNTVAKALICTICYMDAKSINGSHLHCEKCPVRMRVHTPPIRHRIDFCFFSPQTCVSVYWALVSILVDKVAVRSRWCWDWVLMVLGISAERRNTSYLQINARVNVKQWCHFIEHLSLIRSSNRRMSPIRDQSLDFQCGFWFKNILTFWLVMTGNRDINDRLFH